MHDAMRAKRTIYGCCLAASLITFLFSPIFAHAQDTKWHKIGRLWEQMEESGTGARGQWPAGRGYQDNLVDIGHWIAVRNLVDADGNTHPYYVAEGGTYFSDDSEFNIPLYIRKYSRNGLPEVTVDGESVGEEFFEADDNFVDPDLLAPEMIESKWRTGAGVTVTRRSYAWAQKDAQDYILLDYTLVNTGEMKQSDGVGQEQTLEDVYFVFAAEPRPGRAGEQAYPFSNSSEIDDWAEFYGADEGDSLKVLYSFDGKSTRGGEMFDPRPTDGYILAPQFVGFGVVHVDRAPGDSRHWDDQPNSVRWRGYGDNKSHASGSTVGEMYEWISSGVIQRKSQDPDPTTYPGKHTKMSFGPYTMAPGDSVRIVLVESVGGITHQEAAQIGRQWREGELDSEAMYELVSHRGEEELFGAVSHAKWTFDQGYRIPEGPPSPDVTVTSGPGQVTVDWSDVSSAGDPVTGAHDFAGYRVYRSEGSADSTYHVVAEFGGASGSPVAHQYVDEDVRRGVAYYYYVTAFDDGSQNFASPGESLESSHYLNRTRALAAHPVREADSNVDNIRVIPNPYNVNSVDLYAGERDKVLFVNLPPVGTIRIFTISGDLVRTIEHTSGSGDEPWDLVTSTNQIVRSGVYVYHVEGQDEAGQSIGSKTGKLVIVR